MTDFGSDKHNFDVILENVRVAIGRDICFPYLCDKTLKAVSFEYSFEKLININFIDTEEGKILNDTYLKIVQANIINAVSILKEKNIKPVLIYGQLNRKLIWNIASKQDREISVISIAEIPNDINVEFIFEMKNDAI